MEKQLEIKERAHSRIQEYVGEGANVLRYAEHQEYTLQIFEHPLDESILLGILAVHDNAVLRGNTLDGLTQSFISEVLGFAESQEKRIDIIFDFRAISLTISPFDADVKAMAIISANKFLGDRIVVTHKNFTQTALVALTKPIQRMVNRMVNKRFITVNSVESALRELGAAPQEGSES